MRKLLIILCLFSCFFVQARPLKTPGKSGIVIDYETGQILFEKDAFTPIAPSNISKLMTLYTAYTQIDKQKLDVNDSFFVSEKALEGIDTGEVTVLLKVGQKIKIKDLLEAVAITYAVDACKVLAEGIAGSEEKFIEMMNSTAKELGLSSSSFTNSYGKNEKGQAMSPYDISALFSKIISQYPEYYKSFNKRFFDYDGATHEEKTKYVYNFGNKNKIIWDMRGADGGVVGFTKYVGYNIVASAVKENRRLIVVLSGLKAQGSLEEINLARAREAKAVMNSVFEDYTIKTFFKTEKPIAKIDLMYGKNKFVAIYPERDVYFMYPNNAKHNIVLNVSFFDRVTAPVKKGQIVGNIDMVVDGIKIDSYKVIIGENVRSLYFGPARFFENLKQFLLLFIKR